jgi:hypothetical protein
MRLDLRKRGSRLWESNPRPTHQEDAASPPPPLHQHRQHTPRLGKHPAAWENAVRHARSHARPARARWPRGTSITRRCSAPRPGCPTLWPPDAATPPPRPLPVSHSGHAKARANRGEGSMPGRRRLARRRCRLPSAAPSGPGCWETPTRTSRRVRPLNLTPADPHRFRLCVVSPRTARSVRIWAISSSVNARPVSSWSKASKLLSIHRTSSARGGGTSGDS